MQFKVPQNVQREDTIIAFLTLKHMIILGIGGGIDYAVYLALAKNYFIEVWLIPVVLIAVITLAIAFFKPHGISFLKFILLQTAFMFKPQKRVWQHGGGDVFMSSWMENTQKKIVDRSMIDKENKDQETMKNLNQITEILDSYGEVEMNDEEGEKHDKLMGLVKEKKK